MIEKTAKQQVLPLVALQTKSWLEQIIVGLNFCPFAKKELVNNSIRYHVSQHVKVKEALFELITQCHYLQEHNEIETSLLIYEAGFKDFENYLDLVDYANDLLIEQGFEGIFQLASFHPQYCFADSDFDDAANFTNRSPYPTLHIIREASMAKVLAVYKNPQQIPENNIALAQQKGSDYFQQVLKAISEQKHW
jgi:uncharacterized protein